MPDSHYMSGLLVRGASRSKAGVVRDWAAMRPAGQVIWGLCTYEGRKDLASCRGRVEEWTVYEGTRSEEAYSAAAPVDDRKQRKESGTEKDSNQGSYTRYAPQIPNFTPFVRPDAFRSFLCS